MAGQMTIAEMKQLIDRLEAAKQDDVEIPRNYIDRLERATQLLQELRNLPTIDWNNITTSDEIEAAEGANHLKLELKNEIESHLRTCGLTVSESGKGRRGRKAAAGEKRKRSANRTPEQKEYDAKLKEIIKAAKETLNLPARGRIREEDQARLEAEMEKQIKKQKLVAPKA